MGHPDQVLDAAAQLRRDDLARSPAYESTLAALLFHRKTFERADVLDVFMGSEGPRALVGRLEGEMPAHGVGSTHLFLHRRRDDPAALQWVKARTASLLSDAKATPFVMLPADEVALRRHLLHQGLRIQYVTQVGRVDTALRCLPDHAQLPLPDSLRWVDMDRSHADAVADLKVAAFSDGRFAFFGAGAGFRELARRAVANGRPFNGRRWVLVDALGVAGLLELHHRRDDAHNAGGSAGIDVVLAPRLRGRGLTWRVYRHLLLSLQQDGLAWIKGATAQPAILRIGRQLGRVPTAMALRGGAPFDESWFSAHLPELPLAR